MYNLEEVKNFYSTSNHIYGRDSKTIRDKLCNYIIDNFNDSNSFFEFGCNVGYNLNRIRKKFPNGEFFGVDINENAIRMGREILGFNLKKGDENSLNDIETNSYDVVFTSSVLNHIPDEVFPPIIENLKRISKKHIIFMEANVDKEPDYYHHNYECFGFKNTWSVFSPVSKKGHDVMYYGWIID